MTSHKKALVALLLLVPVPSIATWFGLIGFEGPVGQTVYSAGKVWIVALPLAWLLLVDRARPRFPRPRREGVPAACVTGTLIFAAIIGAYWLFGHRWINAEAVRAEAFENGLDTRVKYVFFVVVLSLVNAMLEEYVWRWFVFTRCEVLMPRLVAVAASGLFFTLHHIIALAAYFDWRVTLLGSVGVFVGGTTWSWLYLRYRNIWAAYISHIFADVAVFGIGWVIVFG